MENKTNDKFWFSEIPGDQLKHLVRIQVLQNVQDGGQMKPTWVTHEIDNMITMCRMDVFRLLEGKRIYKETEAMNNLINNQNV